MRNQKSTLFAHIGRRDSPISAETGLPVFNPQVQIFQSPPAPPHNSSILIK